ncbi:MAG: hypothetical protein R2763_08620 [Mycobacterium sp.]
MTKGKTPSPVVRFVVNGDGDAVADTVLPASGRADSAAAIASVATLPLVAPGRAVRPQATSAAPPIRLAARQQRQRTGVAAKDGPIMAHQLLVASSVPFVIRPLRPGLPLGLMSVV